MLKEYIDKCEDNAKKMIKEQNGYEKYSEWFEVIKNICQRGDAIKTDDDNHYILSDNIHVYINSRKEVIISEGEFQGLGSGGRYWTMHVGTIRDSIGMHCGNDSAASICYGAEGTQSMGSGSGKDYSCLPFTSDIEKRDILQEEKTGDFPTDMRAILSEALDKAEDDETKKTYEDTIKFYDKIENIIELERQKVEKMSTQDLEKMLESIKANNTSKREELESLRKKQLISQIRDAIKEGRDLDSKIAEAKENTIENL